jgi:hypothetical protein
VLEFALLAPVLALLLVIVTDSMRLCRAAIELNGAAQAAAAYAAQSPLRAADRDGIARIALRGASRFTDLKSSAAVFCQCPGFAVGRCDRIPLRPGFQAYVRIEAAATFHALIHYPGLGNSLRLKSVAVRRVE